MLEPGNPNYRLQDLEQRWAADPDSRLYQQLAEEYRKAGRTEKAAEVLQEGLERRPRDIGGHVALGRCYLDLQQSEQARACFETVIDRDPAHHVANKLLIEAHLLAGDAEAASERLEIYQLLNDRDPEIEHFAYRLRQLRTQPEAGAPVEESAASGDGADTSVRSDDDSEFDDTLPMGTSIEDVASASMPRPTFAGPQARTVQSEPTTPFEEAEALVAGAGLSGDAGLSRESSTMADEAPAVRDEIFALGAPPEPPAMDSLWAEAKASRHTRARDPFAGLLDQPWVASGAAESELFPQATVPPTVAPPAPAPQAGQAASEQEPVTELEPVPEPVAEVAAVQEPIAEEAVAEVPVVETVAGDDVSLEEAAKDDAEEEARVDAGDDGATAPLVAAAAIAGTAITAAAVGAMETASEDVEAEAADAAIEPAPVAEIEPSLADAPTEAYSEWVEDRSAIDELAPTQPLPKISVPDELADAAEGAESPEATGPPEAAIEEVSPVDTVQAGSGLGPVEVGPEDGPTGQLEPFVAEPFVAESMPGEAMEAEHEAPDGVAEAADGEDVATVTLGNLYLKQGHLGEAAKVFEQVLAHEPDNAAAHEGLAMAQGAGFPSEVEEETATTEAAAAEPAATEAVTPLEAADPEPVHEPVVAAPETVAMAATARPEGDALTAQGLLQAQVEAGSLPADPTAQKVLVLSNYLKHLKMARERHDVH